MKRFSGTLNRGLVLGAVLALGTTAYVAVDYMRFSNGKPEMEATLKGYADAMAKASVYPAKQQTFGYELSDEESKSYLEGLCNAVRSYWTESESSESVLDIFTSYTSENVIFFLNLYTTDSFYSTLPGKITGLGVELSKITLKKNGPGSATYEADVKMQIESSGTSVIYMLNGFPTELNTITEDSYLLENSSGDEYVYNGSLISTYSCEISGELTYVDGEWKISTLSQYNDEEFTSVYSKGEN